MWVSANFWPQCISSRFLPLVTDRHMNLKTAFQKTHPQSKTCLSAEFIHSYIFYLTLPPHAHTRTLTHTTSASNLWDFIMNCAACSLRAPPSPVQHNVSEPCVCDMSVRGCFCEKKLFWQKYEAKMAMGRKRQWPWSMLGWEACKSRRNSPQTTLKLLPSVVETFNFVANTNA